MFIFFILAFIIHTYYLYYVNNKSFNDIIYKIFVSGTIYTIAFFVCLSLKYFSIYDTEILNGEILDKKSELVSCSHTYRCNCVNVQTCSSNSNGTQSCTNNEVCSTCYEHPYDKDWFLTSTVGRINIDRVDRQGLMTPAPWSNAYIGEPASVEHTFVNFLLADDKSIFYSNDLSNEDLKNIPKYPRVKDYYKLPDRVINLTSKDVNYKNLSTLLDQRLKTLGSKKELNIILVILDKDIEYSKKILQFWKGTKKNDVILFISINTSDNSVLNVHSESYANGMNNHTLHIHLRDNYINKKLDTTTLSSIIDDIDSEFNRISEAEFEYLGSNVNTPWYIILISLIISFGLITLVNIFIEGKLR